MKSFTRSGHEELHGTITGRASARFDTLCFTFEFKSFHGCNPVLSLLNLKEEDLNQSIGAFARHGWISCYYTLYYDLLSCVCDVKDRYIFSALQKMGTQTQNHRRLLIRSIPFRPLCYGAIYVVECEAEH
ncbi:hypothetical protein B296_00023372 [Ensete ventricosum]|uniref:Uncharacterized protein n=1 Tax=Ensete ventricosum TaxID=4639 RepID=A0A427AWM8_ENSVE|nr:hypothetical protein B296_00023372 [Ensete ventricosum]